MADGDNTKGAWWHGPLIGGVMTLCTGVAGFVGTHWGGVTNDQMEARAKRTELLMEQRFNELTMAIAKSGDQQKQYIDEKLDTPAPKARKKRKGDGQ